MANPGPLTLSAEIDELRKQFEHISAEAHALVARLSETQFSWKPAPDVWSVAECLEHMNATARSYLPALDEAVDNAIRQGTYAQGPFTYNWFGRILVRLSEPPAWLRVTTSARMLPGRTRPRRETLAGFRAYQVQYIDRLRQANGIDLARARARPPVLTWLRIPLGCAFELMAAHERRHLWQATKVTQMAQFPPSESWVEPLP